MTPGPEQTIRVPGTEIILKKPRRDLPKGACDAHFHVLGPQSLFPFALDRPYTPAEASRDDLLRTHAFLGFQRGLVVQSACHGYDHSAMLDLLAAAPDRYRGVALLRPSTTAAEIARLESAGVCGVRFHFHFPHLPPPPPREEMRAVIALVEPRGWHVAIHVGGSGIVDEYDFLASIAAPVVIDHIARLDVAEGLNGRTFAALCRLVDRGNVWVKLSGADRFTKQPFPYRDAVPFARELARRVPERVLWGSDWPHPNHAATPNDGDLVDLIAEIAPGEATRQLMLVDNPASVFGFAAATQLKTPGPASPDAARRPSRSVGTTG